MTSTHADQRLVADYVTTRLSPKRLRHTIGVAETATGLALRVGLDPGRARLSGLIHDLAREWEPTEMIATARRDGLALSDLEKKNPVLLHGRAAAQFARESWGINDEGVLNAVRHHTLGTPNPGPLDLLLYCADYVEPNRPFLDERLQALRESAPLPQLTLAIIEHIRTRGHELAPPTRGLRDAVVKMMESA